MNKIKYLVMDVDGTLTNGKFYIGNEGEVFKTFDTKDGFAIKHLLPEYGIIPIIITARESKIVSIRAKELNVKEVYQGIENKFEYLIEILRKRNEAYTLDEVAYIGDDLLDLKCMDPIKEKGGKIGCPADAIDVVKEISDFVSSKAGGNGAVREFIEWIIAEMSETAMI